MAGFTNKGKAWVLGVTFPSETLPSNYYLALITDANVPDVETNTLSDLTEIALGNGYSTGGSSLNLDSTDFDNWDEDDVNDRGSVQIKDVVFTASGGNLPSSGNGARYAVLTDDNATIGSRLVYAYFDLGSDRTVSDTQTITVRNCTMRANES